MTQLLGPYADYTYALLRIIAGYLFMLHGARKLFPVLGREAPVELMSVIGAAGIIEFFGGTLIALGLFTSYAAFIASGEMAVAYFFGHAGRSGIFLFPLQNLGEPAVLNCFIFLYLASRGSGALSVDRLRGQRP